MKALAAPVVVPATLVLDACAPLALAELRLFVDLGARIRPDARVVQRGFRLVALFDFDAPIEVAGRSIACVQVPLHVVMGADHPSEALVARIRAGDEIADRLRAARAQAIA